MIANQHPGRDIEYLEDVDPKEWMKSLNEMIDQVNYLAKNLSLRSFDGKFVDLTFAAGEIKVISHNLGVVPKYRIILRQEGNGVIDDVPSGWNENSIKLRNNGAVQVKATVIIVRE